MGRGKPPPQFGRSLLGLVESTTLSCSPSISNNCFADSPSLLADTAKRSRTSTGAVR
jgi:hypothetical protein